MSHMSTTKMTGISFVLNLLPFLFFIPVEAADCDFTLTSCSCSFRSDPAGTCYDPVPFKPGACLPRACHASWRCDCFNPTHLCTRTTCMSYQAVTTPPQPIPRLTGSEVQCPKQSSFKCVSQTGQPIRPIALLTPSPSPTKSPVVIPVPSSSFSPSVSPSSVTLTFPTCTDSSTCPTNTVCILGKCRQRGTCDAEMQTYCETFGPDRQCCSEDTVCARIHLAGDDSFCGTDCSEFCLVSGGRTECSFRISGDTVSITVPGGSSSWTLAACSSVS